VSHKSKHGQFIHVSVANFSICLSSKRRFLNQFLQPWFTVINDGLIEFIHVNIRKTKLFCVTKTASDWPV